MNDQNETIEYEVALSFAGEDRPYVREVKDQLRSLGVTVFYDEDEQPTLWGQDLYVYLDRIYRKASLYCVMFISRAYATKLWTNHERMSLQARDFLNSHDGTVLPARFDDTEISGLLPQIGYIDLRKLSPLEFATIIAEKVRGRRRLRLENALSRSFILALDYLAPRSLASADSLAQEIRTAFTVTGYAPSYEFIEPYLLSPNADRRVVGYLAYQVAPYPRQISEQLSICLDIELRHALATRETRPLWQLLVCIALFGAVTDAESRQFVNFRLDMVRDALRARHHIDTGRECVAKLDALIALFPWMARMDRRFSGRRPKDFDRKPESFAWEFVWQSDETTYSLREALEYIRAHPDIARRHIVEGHFLDWYSLSLTSDADVLDLMVAITRQIELSTELEG